MTTKKYIEGTAEFKVDIQLLKEMLILAGFRIENLSDEEIVKIGLERLTPYGFIIR